MKIERFRFAYRERSGRWRSSLIGATMFFCVGAAPFAAKAAAWVEDQGSGQAIVTGLFSKADEAFLDTPELTEPADFQKGAVSLLFDYGVLSWLTITANIEFGSETSDRLPFRRPGLANASLGARAQIYRSDTYAMSVEIAGRAEDVYGDADLEVDTFGWDSPLLEARWSGGRNVSVFGRAAFADVSAGYRYRFGEGPDELLLDTTLGVKAFARTTLLAQTFTTIGYAKNDEIAYARQKSQGSVVYDLNENWSVQSGAFATFIGQNVLKERGGFAALWYRF